MNGKLLVHPVLFACLVAGAAAALEGGATVGNAVEPASLLPSATADAMLQSEPTSGLADVAGAALAIKTVASAGYLPPSSTRLN
ncbi:hypothetical protein [Psychromarinibacter sp. S121]|uniref:hypothetical protein n=1 Tax=Psychromarinibacter sp. S121 TaxID=3415127 RepID=UPI003C7E6FA2